MFIDTYDASIEISHEGTSADCDTLASCLDYTATPVIYETDSIRHTYYHLGHLCDDTRVAAHRDQGLKAETKPAFSRNRNGTHIIHLGKRLIHE